jgi:ATP-dependent protease ClpP protease subunit
MSILNGSALTLYGAVGEDFDDKQVRDALDEHGAGDITVNLNSGGGIAMMGLAIYNLLKSHAGKITVYIDAMAASAASLIAMAGDTIVMREGALMMIHDPSAMAAGTSRDLRANADALDMISEQARGIYAKRTGLDPKTVADMMMSETWMDADQAVSLGFATSKVAEPAMAVATFDYRLYRNSPTMLTTKGNISMPIEDTNKDKPWSYRFIRSAETSGIALAELNAIIDASASIDIAKDSLIDAMAKANSALPRAGGGWDGWSRGGDDSFSNPEFLGKAISDAMYARMSGKAPAGPAREWAGRTLLDMGEATLRVRGERVTWKDGKQGVARSIMSGGGQHTTSDFPNLLQAAGNRFLLEAYQANQSPLKQLARRRTTQDFRAINVLRLGEAPSLDEVIEGGEVKYGTRAESKEAYSVKTFAKIFSLSRNALINDDLSAFADGNTAWGQAAAQRESAVITGLFLANAGNGANLADGNPFYTTGRGNKAGAGSALDFAGLDTGRQALRTMKGLDGVTPINATPKYLVVGAELESTAEQMVRLIASTKSDDVNPFSGNLTPLVEARFTGKSWRLFADEAQLPAFEIAYLNGVEGPIIEQRAGWDVLGIEFRTIMDIGAGLTEWRASYLNPGL